eukprot:TRINITY_DN7095_c0_g1_i2.p1 TRINITY_DN7095_c0_g1~~TRINITY_DN7095_c0_g1_i2.p1  ORF type:complete len:603 (+),score=83.53 TRINITY_DN7095_c0_g1_i2:161-1810(+)
MEDRKVPAVDGFEGRQCEWDGDWSNVVGLNTDQEGWTYSVSFRLALVAGWSTENEPSSCVRRRMWTRKAKVMNEFQLRSSCASLPVITDASQYPTPEPSHSYAEHPMAPAFRIVHSHSGKSIQIPPSGKAIYSSIPGTKFRLINNCLAVMDGDIIRGYLGRKTTPGGSSVRVVLQKNPGYDIWRLDKDSNLLWNMQHPPLALHPAGGHASDGECDAITLHNHTRHPERLAVHFELATSSNARRVDLTAPRSTPFQSHILGALRKQNEVFKSQSLAIRGSLSRRPTGNKLNYPCQDCGISEVVNELHCGHTTCTSCLKKDCELLAEWLRTRDTEIYKMLSLKNGDIGYYVCPTCTTPTAVAIDELNSTYFPLTSTESPPLVWRVFEIYQNNRKIPFGDYSAGALLPTDRNEWSTESGTDCRKVSDSDIPSDKEFRFICPWHSCQWMYRGNWHSPIPWAKKPAAHKFVRRRKWVRLAINARSTAQLRRDHKTVLVIPRNIASTLIKSVDENVHSVWPAGYCAPWVGHAACSISSIEFNKLNDDANDVLVIE